MTAWKILVLFVGAMTLAGSAWAGGEMPQQRTYSPEFQAVKQLAGTWVGTATEPDGKSGPVTVIYRVTSAGSAVEERLMVGSPEEMVDMYHDADGRLTMTHYCALGNRPHMLLRDSSPGRLALEMGPTPGIDPARDLHMHALVLEFPEPDRLVQRWTGYQDGKPKGETVLTLTRKEGS